MATELRYFAFSAQDETIYMQKWIPTGRRDAARFENRGGEEREPGTESNSNNNNNNKTLNATRISRVRRPVSCTGLSALFCCLGPRAYN